MDADYALFFLIPRLCHCHFIFQPFFDPIMMADAHWYRDDELNNWKVELVQAGDDIH
jgi:hypothetical protein